MDVLAGKPPVSVMLTTQPIGWLYFLVSHPTGPPLLLWICELVLY